MNTDPREKSKNDFGKDILILLIMQFLEKLEIMRENITEEKTTWCQNQIIILQSFSRKVYQQQTIKKTKILINKLVYSGLSMKELSKIVVYEFCYDYVKRKFGEKAKLCYKDTGSFIVCIKTEIFIKKFQNMLKLDLMLNYELSIKALRFDGKL